MVIEQPHCQRKYSSNLEILSLKLASRPQSCPLVTAAFTAARINSPLEPFLNLGFHLAYGTLAYAHGLGESPPWEIR
jgi:hypothetical protein